jgi:NAD(P)-dependent dehydrogenase (short-subunit alcohol dehydrogenase family)
MSDAFSLAGKDILVVGATSEIGGAIAHAIVQNGGRVSISGRNQDKLSDLAGRLGGGVIQSVVLDYADRDAVKAFLQSSSQYDGLLFAGGFVPRLLPFRLTSPDEAASIMNANFTAPAAFLQELLKHRKLRERGSCVFISSVAAGGSPEATAYYSAGKAALLSLLRSVGSEYGRRGYRFNSVAYGYLRGATIERIGVSEDRLGFAPLGVPASEEVVGAPLFLLSEASKWITRKTFVVDGGVNLKQHWVI